MFGYWEAGDNQGALEALDGAIAHEYGDLAPPSRT
jgi:hypothetical protein